MTSEQDRPNDAHAQALSIPERFTFDAGSSALSPEATETASRVAKQLRADPIA